MGKKEEPPEDPLFEIAWRLRVLDERLGRWENLVRALAKIRDVGELSCSFCARPQKEVRRLLTGPGANICSDCVEESAKVLRELPPR